MGNSTRRHLSHKGTKEHKPGIHEYIRVVRTMFDATLEEHGMFNGIQTLAPVQEVVVSGKTDSEHESGSQSESESEDEGAYNEIPVVGAVMTKIQVLHLVILSTAPMSRSWGHRTERGVIVE